MKILSDGSVIQSALSVEPQTRAKEAYRMDFALKRGVVIAIYYPEDKHNLNKQFIEYDVLTADERADGSTSSVVYSRCQAIDRFGSPNNYEYYTYQPHKETNGNVYKKGAQVLLLALHGNAAGGRAVIVGGLPYPKEQKPKKEDGQFYEWQFNGINIKVDKDGQYSLTFNSPIDQDGKKKDEKAAGTKIEIFKDGKMRLSDNAGQFWEIDRVNESSTWGNGSESIKIDKKNKKIELNSGGDFSETVKNSKTIKVESKDYTVSTGSGSINEKSGKDITLDAKANIKQKSGAAWQIEAGGNVSIKAGGAVNIEGGSMAKLKGQINMIGDGSVPAAGVGISQCIGTGNNGAPVISDIITGSSTVLIGS